MAKIRIKDLAFVRHDSVVMVDGCLEEAVRAGRYDLPDCWNPCFTKPQFRMVSSEVLYILRCRLVLIGGL